MKETYYAIRIGKRPKCLPYLMLDHPRTTPALFITKSAAQLALNFSKIDSSAKVVAVTINFPGK